MNVEYADLRGMIADVGRRLYEKGLVAATDGNISALAGDGTVLITPGGVSKGSFAREDVCVIDARGACISGDGPSSEYKLHLAAYRARPDIRACVHAHPPTATAFAVAGVELNALALPEAVLALGRVGIAPYAAAASSELAEGAARMLVRSNAVLLANHGAVVVGTSLEEAYRNMELLEHCARIMLYARLLGGERELPKSELERLLGAR